MNILAHITWLPHVHDGDTVIEFHHIVFIALVIVALALSILAHRRFRNDSRSRREGDRAGQNSARRQ
jgi:hypothetical protein